MAAKKNYMWLGGAERITPINSNSQFEFDESEIWLNKEEPFETTKRVQRPLKKPIKKSSHRHNDEKTFSATSLPLNIPDWSKILGKEYKDCRVDQNDNDDEDDEEDMDDRIPPHEYLARTRGASFSVHEGVGRTLKGRDLSRVRNAIWKKTGFED